jgi:hypothetical protein
MFVARNCRFLLCAVAALIAVAFLTPGSKAGLFGPSTPQEKLSEANDLIFGPGRVGKARQLIEEARAECEKNNDKACLSEVYRLYGLLERYGFTDAIIVRGNIDNIKPTPEELDRSDARYTKALDLATEVHAFDKVTNINFLLAGNQKLRGVPQGPCIYLDRALAAAKEAQRLHPDEKMRVSPPFQTVDEWLEQMKKNEGCPNG